MKMPNEVLTSITKIKLIFKISYMHPGNRAAIISFGTTNREYGMRNIKKATQAGLLRTANYFK